ncbi:helicase-associated domain-containing protein [Moorella naiadis]|uniref:helicase-associated domain-containing protein n=1 Tax=Moorella naiadis (nom. illeg.) TaxID=3093670 RepID=UPI003D9C8187
MMTISDQGGGEQEMIGSYQEILTGAPFSFLRNLALNLNRPLVKDKKLIRLKPNAQRQELLKDLLAFYSSPDNREKLWEMAGSQGQFMLQTILFNDQPADVSRIHEQINKTFGKGSAKEIRDRLLAYGLLFTSDGGGPREYYLIPLEVRGIIYRHTAATLMVKEGELPAGPVANHGLFLLVDFWILLISILQQEIRVTQAGNLYKRERKHIQLLQHYPQDEERYLLLETLGWRLGFIKEEDGLAYLDKEAGVWLRRPRVEQWLSLVGWLLGRDFEDTRWLWPTHVMTALMVLQEDQWLSLPELYRLIKKIYIKQYLNYNLQYTRDFLQRALWVGAIEMVGNLETGAIRVTDIFRSYIDAMRRDALRQNHAEERNAAQGSLDLYKKVLEHFLPEVGTFVVQPNYEIIAPLELAPPLLLLLSGLADLKSADRTFIFNLTEKSFYRGFTAGRQPEEMVKFLREHSKYELPTNVGATLEEWAAKMGTISLVRGALVRCRSTEEAVQVQAWLQARGWLLEQITPTDFLIPENVAYQCLHALEEEGYMPYPQVTVHRVGPGDRDYDKDYDKDDYNGAPLQEMLKRALEEVFRKGESE